MAHSPLLIQDLGVILFSAGIITVIFKWLKQPVVLGYIVVGMMAGPYMFGESWIGDSESVNTWGEIGVIFLLFALGLEFSFRKLLNVGGAALIGAVTIVVGMMTSGYLLGKMLGWTDMNSLFLGGMLSMSSTTIVFKALDDMGLRKQQFANVVFGVLVVEDLFAVVLMVLLSTLAVSQQFEGVQMMESIVKLGTYLLFWFVGGIFLVPSFLKKTRGYLNEETLLVVTLGLCLGMVILAIKAGFSAALGAFVMGSILAETIEAERIEKLVQPVKNLFGAVFFVSVGMMIDPMLLLEYWKPITLITFVVIVGQIMFSGFGIILSGQGLKVAIQSGFSLVQIGEFAFIIASLGVSLGVTDKSLYPIVVAVSVITTFLTPYIIRLADPTYRFLDRRLPASTKKLLERYSRGSNTLSHKSVWNKLLKDLSRIVLIYGVISLCVVTLFLRYLSPLINKVIPDNKGSYLSLAIIVLLISPFLRAIMMKKNHSREFIELWHDSRFNRGYLVGLVAARILLCVFFMMFIIASLFNLAVGMIFAASVVIVVCLILSKQVKKQSIQMERRFTRNLKERERESDKKAPVRQRFVKSMLARDLHLADFEILPNSPSEGRLLKELDFRQRYGVNIVKIVRGDRHINIPSGNVRIYPMDKIVVAGTDKQITAFRVYIEERNKNAGKYETEPHESVTIEQFVIGKNSVFVGMSIKESDIRSKAHCQVIGIERGNTSLLNPSPSVVFEQGDLVWVAGESSRLSQFLHNATARIDAAAAETPPDDMLASDYGTTCGGDVNVENHNE